MKNVLPIMLTVFCLACSKPHTAVNEKDIESAELKREAKSSEDTDEWQILFDGSHTDQWIALGTNKFPENGWVIENGALVLNEGGDIITREKYGDFELSFEFNFTEGANSGIKYNVAELTDKESGKSVMNGPEYQIIDDVHNPDIQNRSDEKSTTAALYLLYPPNNKKLLPAGQWNTARIIAKKGQVEHWLNGVKVVSYERGSQDFLKRKAETKFKNYTNYGEADSGHIMLTDHHDKVYFRDIKIKRL